MKRPKFMFRPNLQNADHRRAWELLQAVPSGQKSAFLVQAILQSQRQQDLESTLRRVLQEEYSGAPYRQEKPDESLPSEMMGFLDSLMGNE